MPAGRDLRDSAVMPKAQGKRPLTLAGSCQCGKVSFTVDSETPVPFMYCFCSICRKTSGSAFGCNVMGIRKSLKVRGKKRLKVHHARVREPGKPTTISEGSRWFCGDCGTHLYITDDRWPNGVWPSVAAIDTELPRASGHVLMMLGNKPSWVPPAMLPKGKRFPRYPKVSIADWHTQHGWPVTVRP
jgi:hypothetical protein